MTTPVPLHPPSPPCAVLDTNVVLDWLLFRNPGVAAMGRAIEHGQLRWLGCPAMRDELAYVAARPIVGQWGATESRLLAAWDRFASVLPEPGPAAGLRCRDASDQKFLNLACAHGARWLLTRDRALLALARRTASRGLRIVPPERWQDLPP